MTILQARRSLTEGSLRPLRESVVTGLESMIPTRPSGGWLRTNSAGAHGAANFQKFGWRSGFFSGHQVEGGEWECPSLRQMVVA